MSTSHATETLGAHSDQDVNTSGRAKIKAAGFRIDAEKRTITPWNYNGDFKTLYPAIGCECFTVATFDPDTMDGVLVDDNGLIGKPPTTFFSINGYPQPLAGNGVVLGVDDEGESISPKITLERLRRNVQFYELLFNHPAHGLLCHAWSATDPRGTPVMMKFRGIQVSDVLLD